jgi:hypothetical protein
VVLVTSHKGGAGDEQPHAKSILFWYIFGTRRERVHLLLRLDLKPEVSIQVYDQDWFNFLWEEILKVMQIEPISRGPV